ncbi:MAG: cyclase family protein [Chloroflexi bacterium]|nr:cyclase family protein [Chloroflexota bacterium]
MANEQDGRALPSQDEVHAWLTEDNNWGRWGDDDEAGAVNLIDAAKRLDALAMARTGRVVSVSRPYPKEPGPTNPTPAQHFVRRNRRPNDTGSVVDYYGFVYHGHNHTHLDALCHVWDDGGAWQGRDPDEFITGEGVTFGDVTAWETGIITRGVLLDVPRYRGEPYVTVDRPVHGWELEEIAAAQGVEVRPGDAVLVHSGREAFQDANPNFFFGDREAPTPGLHATCMRYIRDRDVAVLVWDMMDARPNEYGLGWAVHPVIYAFGVALVDNALLLPLAEACAEEGRYEFLLIVAPLRVQGGTGSPVNPLAIF